MGSIDGLVESFDCKSIAGFIVALLLHSTEPSLDEFPRFLILNSFSLVVALWVANCHYPVELPRLIPTHKITIFFPSLDVIVVESTLKLFKLVAYPIVQINTKII
jgi:hypothetical protein